MEEMQPQQQLTPTSTQVVSKTSSIKPVGAAITIFQRQPQNSGEQNRNYSDVDLATQQVSLLINEVVVKMFVLIKVEII